MSTTALAARPVPLAGLRVWVRHLLCFVFPVLTLAFVASGPHPWYVALLWLVPPQLFEWLDHQSGAARHEPVMNGPSWPFDAMLYALVGLQLLNIGLLARLFSVQSLWSADGFIAVWLVGANSAVSGIVVAHELIHRKAPHMRLLGRVLLCTVLYEHFFTEHLRGHHVRVGTPDDPATARFGETFGQFLRRTIPGQFRSAWRLEGERLGDADMKLWDARVLRSRVVHGLLAEWAVAAVIAVLFGPTAFAVFVLQAGHAIVSLEEVNYLEHWGLMRSVRKVRPVDSWDTDSSFTLFGLVGLSRHADHHAYAARPFQQLRYREESPKLPTGYFAMDLLVIFRNRRFQALMTDELRRRRLGPFAEA
jgi:alkane 1-monooxygenase